MVNVLDIKVLRDLWSMRLQVLSIAMLVAAGVAVFVMSVSNYLALVGAMADAVRPDALETLQRLRAIGIERVLMVTGDDVETATAVAADLPIDEVRADCSPAEKVTAIRAEAAATSSRFEPRKE